MKGCRVQTIIPLLSQGSTVINTPHSATIDPHQLVGLRSQAAARGACLCGKSEQFAVAAPLLHQMRCIRKADFWVYTADADVLCNAAKQPRGPRSWMPP